MKVQKVIKIAAMIPSLLIAAVHFVLCVRIGPQANIVFQKLDDSGPPLLEGGDATIAAIYRILAQPVPSSMFFEHPVHGLPIIWWAATLVNSVVWGLSIYFIYIAATWIVGRVTKSRFD
jgi:hypothetical protein